MQAPLLMLVAGADAHIPVQDSLDVAEAVRARGLTAEHVVFDGMPHSFFDRSYAEHADACADAWRRMLAFVGV